MNGYALNIFGVQPLKFSDPERHTALSPNALDVDDAYGPTSSAPNWPRIN